MIHALSGSGLPPLALAALCGAVTVLGFAPWSWFLVPPVALAVFFLVLREASPRAGFWRGWAFGAGLLGVGVFWIRISLDEFGNMDPWLASGLTVLFIGVTSLYYALFGWSFARLSRMTAGLSGPRHGALPWTGPLLLFPGLYVLFEWLRGWLFTGFPWLSLGYTQVTGPLAGFAPLIGVHGLSLLILLSAALLAGALIWPPAWRWRALAALAILWLAGWALARVEWTQPVGEPLTAAVVQASIPQSIKWDPDLRLTTIEAYWDLTEHFLHADLILWPETAVPDFLHEVRAELIVPLAERARVEGISIVLGIPVLDRQSGRYYNGLLSLGAQEDLYAKRHLVPFGEFIPFKSWLGPLAERFAVPMSDFSRGEAPRPLLRVGEHWVGASICYEDAFPAEVAQALPEAAFLVNVSNDAWFGDSLAPHQHLEIARLRALETGRPLARATNTGISAIVDHRGKLLGTVPSFVRGGFSAEVQPRAGATPFVRLGHWPAVGGSAAAVLIVVWFGWRRRRAA